MTENETPPIFQDLKLDHPFTPFGRLKTWIVGIQYYTGAGAAAGEDVVFECDPENPFDPHAVAVFTPSGDQVGYLPRYDAEYFSPLILDGLIALKGRAGESERGDRLPLELEVYSTAKVSEILVRDEGDHWRAIYHNLFIDVWERLPELSSVTLREFRNRFRPLAHDQPLYPKTQFLYRMLKAHITERENRERKEKQEQVLTSVESMNLGSGMGWPEFTVIPLYADKIREEPTDKIHEETDEPVTESSALTVQIPVGDRLQEVVRQLPSRYPCPPGARGAILLVQGVWHSLDWFESPECTQVYWFPMVLSGIEAAMKQPPPAVDPPIECKPVKEWLLDALREFQYELTESEDGEEGQRIDFKGDIKSGYALYRNSELIRMRVGEYVSEIQWLDGELEEER